MNLNLLAPINKTGYGYVGLNILKALHAKQVKTSLFPLGGVEAESQYHALINQGLEEALYYDNLAPSLRIFHQHDLSLHAGKGVHVGFPIFELDYLSPQIIHQLDSLDKVFVTSQWAKTVCETNTPISIIPLGVDPEIFRDDPFYGRKDPFEGMFPTTFLNCGKWEYRKGHDVILKAFEKAFSHEDNVKLIMNCYNPCSWIISKMYNSEWEVYYRSSKLGDKIEIPQSRFHCQVDVARLMASVDCGVFPSRAEGWNLELLEMMAMGKPVITTNFSAHTEFCNSDNAMLVDVNATERAYDGVFFKDQNEIGCWAELGPTQIDQIAEHMKHIHECRKRGIVCYNEEGVRTARKYSWSNTVDLIVEELE